MPGRSNGEAANRGLDIRGVLTDSSLVVSATAMGGAVLFFASLFIAKFLGPIQFGQFRAVVGLVGTLTVLIEFGTGPTLLKYVSELGVKQTRDLVRRVLAFRAVLFLGLACAVFLFRGSLAHYILKDPALAHYLVAGSLFVCCVYFDISKILVLAHRKTKLLALSLAATSVAHGLLAAGLMLGAGVFGAVLGWGLAYLVGNVMNLWYLIKSGGLASGPRMAAGRVLLRYGLPMQFERAVRGTELAVIPLWSLFFDQASIGALAFAMLFYQAVMRVHVAVNAVLLPRFAEMSSELDRAQVLLRKVLILLTPMIVLGSLLVPLVAQMLIDWLDSEFLGAMPILRVLTAYGFVSGYGLILGGYFAALGRVRHAILTTVVQQSGLLLVSYIGLSMVS